MKLYELNEAFVEIMDLDLEAEDLENALQALTMSLEDKAENIGKVLRELETESDRYKAEISRLSDKKKSVDNRHKRLKEYLSDTFKLMGVDKMQTDLFKFSFIKSQAIIFTDEDMIDERFISYTKKISKTDIKKAIKNGEVVDGAEIVENKSFQVK